MNSLRTQSHLLVIAAAVGLAASWIALPSLTALSRHSEISSPSQCPDGLTVKSKATEGMIAFDVYVDAEAIANNELYQGRIKAHAYLKIVGHDQGEVASLLVHGGTDKTATHYQFRLAEAAAKNSELQIGVHLFEEDGIATLGGSVSLQVKLGGFLPSGQ